MRIGTADFDEVTFVDFEFTAPPGENPRPICMVVHRLVEGTTSRYWTDDLARLRCAPFPIDKRSVVVAYYASAEIGCFLALGWELPSHVLDLFAEFRTLTNGKLVPYGNGLLGALSYLALDPMSALDKDANRELAIRGAPFTADERERLLAYCESDVTSLVRLFQKMSHHLDIGRALLRGRYMKAAARIERAGIPIDMAALHQLRANWPLIKGDLIRLVDRDFGVFDGTTFKADLWAKWLSAHNIPWPRLPSGRLDLSDDTFREMAKAYPAVAPIRELRSSLSQLRLEDLAVGSDGRNRCLLSAFRARSGRNAPSNSKFVFGPSVWLRSLIKPGPGMGLAYVDWEQQEFGIAAVLSKDARMLEAYASGDPYLAFAKQAGAVPGTATKATHSTVRELFKTCALGVQYGMGDESLAARIGLPLIQARELLRLHHETYAKYWSWSDAVVTYAALHRRLHTVFGWYLHIEADLNSRSWINHPMQSNGAEMLRLACCLATERGIKVVAPIHDAIMIEAPLDRLEAEVARAQAAMAEASRVVLDGFELRSDVKLIRHPDRYQDPRGQRMWNEVWAAIEANVQGPAIQPIQPNMCGFVTGDLCGKRTVHVT
jgi:DNA polymerase-1